MLQLTCDPKSAVLHGHMQSSRESVTQDARSQLRWNKAMICFLVLAPAVNTGPFYGLFPDTLSTFLCFLMVDPLFTMVRSTVLKCHLLSTGMQLDECHSARATMPLAASSVSVSQQHTLKKVSLNRNTGKIRLVLISWQRWCCRTLLQCSQTHYQAGPWIVRVHYTLFPCKRIRLASFTVWGKNYFFYWNKCSSEGDPPTRCAYVSAMLPGCLGGQPLDSLPVELGSATVVLGIGVVGVTPVLVEKGRLQRKICRLTATLH